MALPAEVVVNWGELLTVPAPVPSRLCSLRVKLNLIHFRVSSATTESWYMSHVVPPSTLRPWEVSLKESKSRGLSRATVVSLERFVGRRPSHMLLLVVMSELCSAAVL